MATNAVKERLVSGASFLPSVPWKIDPEQARLATDGFYLMEVFSAIALASLDTGFFERLTGPKYNPDRRKIFRTDDWVRVAEAAAQESHALGCEELAEWCRGTRGIAHCCACWARFIGGCARAKNPFFLETYSLDTWFCQQTPRCVNTWLFPLGNIRWRWTT